MLPHLWTKEIYYVTDEKIITSTSTTKRRIGQLYICTDPENSDRPVVLGAGSYAVVVLASFSADPNTAVRFAALKLLRMDKESDIYSSIGQMRFYAEVAKTRKFGSDHPFLVGYLGFGNVGDTKEPEKKREAQRELEEIYGSELQEVQKLNENVQEFLERGLTLALMGEFYVMTAESGTVGDFLLQEYSWGNNPYYVQSATTWTKLSNLSHGATDRVAPARDMLRDLGITLNSNDKSGLGILTAIDSKEPNFANRAVMQLFEDMIVTVTELHSRTGQLTTGVEPDRGESLMDTGWAHRDIKPNNFLMAFAPPDLQYNIKATDLGFVIGANQAGNKETLSGTKDPGVLALGSYLYRAPEQRESRYEVSFELPPTGKSRRVSFVNTGDMQIYAGDLFESDNVLLEGERDPDPGVPVRATITEAQNKGGKWEIALSNSIVAKSPQILYAGDIVKLAGQHSDLYSLGATLYLLASGGKNPEKFYVKYLEDVPTDLRETQSEFAYISDSCFKMAMALGLQPWERKQREADKLYADVLTQDDRNFLARYVSSGDDVAPKRKWSVGRERKEEQESGRRLARYLTALRDNPMIQYYLSNRNGTPIPFCILFEILRLMMRDKEHSYVGDQGNRAGTAGGADTEQSSSYGYFAMDLRDRAAECLRSCRKAISRSEDLEFAEGKFQQVAPTAAKMVFVLRVLFDKIVGEEAGFELKGHSEEKPGDWSSEASVSNGKAKLQELGKRLSQVRREK